MLITCLFDEDRYLKWKQPPFCGVKPLNLLDFADQSVIHKESRVLCPEWAGPNNTQCYENTKESFKCFCLSIISS